MTDRISRSTVTANGASNPAPSAEYRTAVHADDAVFSRVHTGNAFEETVERLLRAIKLGLVSPGERFPPERELASRLGVSRVTLREALRVLEGNGYVESRRGRYGGTFVNATAARPGRARLRQALQDLSGGLEDAFTFRSIVEVGAAGVAAERDHTDHQRAHLIHCLETTETADLSSYRRKDSRLHLAVAELSGSPSLTSAVADARMRINTLLDAIPLLEPNIAHSNAQHRTFVTSILDQDPGNARSVMAEHLDATAALLRGFLG